MQETIPSFAVVGAGDRGTGYAAYTEAACRRAAGLPEGPGARVAAVAEPDPVRRERFADRFGLPASARFPGWKELFAGPRLAEGVVIATRDGEHVEPALAALEAGYAVLLEKPMALSEEDCRRLAAASEAAGLPLLVCHVLRYHPFFKAVRGLVEEGAIGDLVSVRQAENVSYWHMAHSYVRGNWRDASASPMILAKCCHDLDLLCWMAGPSARGAAAADGASSARGCAAKPLRVASFGSNLEFRPERAPAGSPQRCVEGCPASAACPYDAVALYLRGKPVFLDAAAGNDRLAALAARLLAERPGLARLLPGLRRYLPYRDWPVSTIAEDLSEAGLERALREGPYGLCAYKAGGSQPDHQETIVEFEGGATAFLAMHGHSYKEGRTLRLDGTRGTIRGSFGGGGALELRDHKTGRRRLVRAKSDLVGHRSADMALMAAFVGVLSGGEAPTTAAESLASHRLAFAADLARREGRVVEL